jgi:hypothetical protein
MVALYRRLNAVLGLMITLLRPITQAHWASQQQPQLEMIQSARCASCESPAQKVCRPLSQSIAIDFFMGLNKPFPSVTTFDFLEFLELSLACTADSVDESCFAPRKHCSYWMKS